MPFVGSWTTENASGTKKNERSRPQLEAHRGLYPRLMLMGAAMLIIMVEIITMGMAMIVVSTTTMHTMSNQQGDIDIINILGVISTVLVC